jgi:hypothetical protein
MGKAMLECDSIRAGRLWLDAGMFAGLRIRRSLRPGKSERIALSVARRKTWDTHLKKGGHENKFLRFAPSFGVRIPPEREAAQEPRQ